MTLQTSRLLLNEMTLNDEEELFNIFKDPMFYYAAALQDNIPYSLAAKRYASWAEESRKQIVRKSWFMSIRIKPSRTFIGAIVLVNLNYHPIYELQIELGYFINTWFQNHGYATEAAFAVQDFAKKDLKVKSVYTSVDPMNMYSCLILKKLGFKVTGYDEISLYKTRDGLPSPRLHYRLIF